MKFVRFCAPLYEPTQHLATGLNYFWCDTKNPCFKNCLDNQTLETCTSYQSYTLFHMAEILGYSKLTPKAGGFEPDLVFRKFSALINRVLRIFGQQRCRECGYLIFPTHGKFGGFSNFTCENQLCTEHNKNVYLSYCYNCKRGVIDSRDTKQCPNNWYICPTCLSCCDDNLIEKCIQKYIIIHKPIPLSLLAQRNNGHNDKRKYFCPQCGTQLIANTNPNINADWLCQTCGRNFKHH